jgi:hypothetical protein
MKNFFAGPTIVTTFAVSLALIMSLNSSWASSPNDIKTPAETSIDLYSDISARNLDGVLQLIPAEGFTEIGVGEGETHRLDKQAFESFFKTDLMINLRAVDVKVQDFGDTAIVTGMRVGSITPRGDQAKEKRHLFTMVWVKVGGRWQLRHVHLSAVEHL